MQVDTGDAEDEPFLPTGPGRGFSVRPAEAEDADGVTAALEAAFPVLARDHYDPEVLRRCLPLICRANPTLLRSGAYFVATSAEGLVVGCGGWSREKPGTDMREPGTGHMRHFATRADWAGRGIGRRIYECAELQAQELGIKRLETYAGLNAVGFYRSLGFEEIGRISYPLTPEIEYPGVHMWRAI